MLFPQRLLHWACSPATHQCLHLHLSDFFISAILEGEMQNEFFKMLLPTLQHQKEKNRSQVPHLLAF